MKDDSDALDSDGSDLSEGMFEKAKNVETIADQEKRLKAEFKSAEARDAASSDEDGFMVKKSKQRDIEAMPAKPSNGTDVL